MGEWRYLPPKMITNLPRPVRSFTVKKKHIGPAGSEILCYRQKLLLLYILGWCLVNKVSRSLQISISLVFSWNANWVHLIKFRNYLQFRKRSIQGGRGHWAVYYTSPKRFIITFSYIHWLNNFRDFYWISIDWVYKVEWPSVLTTNR